LDGRRRRVSRRMAGPKESVSMSNLSPQRKKVVLLACSISCLIGPGLLITFHLHGSRYLPAFVICWCVLMGALFAFTFAQFVKLKRSEG
jgi:hypothetical protein